MMRCFLLAFFVSCLACQDMDNFPERVDKLRAIGVRLDKGSYVPSTSDSAQTITLTFILSSPDKNAAMTPSPVSLEGGVFLDIPSVTEVASEDFEQLRVSSFQAVAAIPPAENLFFDEEGVALVSYGYQFSQGGEVEIVRGRVKIYKVDPELSPPKISISSPSAADSTAAAAAVLKAEVSNTTEEPYRIGWFVAEGEVPQRRALEADWEKVTPGVKTVIVTVRGLRNFGFDYQALDVTLN